MKSFNILLVVLFFCSCSSNNEALIKFEEKLSNTNSQIIKKIIIAEADNDYFSVRNIYSMMLLNDKKLSKIDFLYIKSDIKKSNDNVILTEYNRDEKKQKLQYYDDSGVIFKHQSNPFEIYDDSKDVSEIFYVDPLWRFCLSTKWLNKYSKNKIENINGVRWNIYYGKISFNEKDLMLEFSLRNFFGNNILFEIWINEDNNSWLEFYRNSDGKLKVVIEGSFLVSKDELEFKEIRNKNDVKKTFKKYFERTLLYKMDILKDTELLDKIN